jgi:anaerobic C4-dicarboxylate transporter
LINIFRIGSVYSYSKIWSAYVLFSIISIAYIVIYFVLRVHYRRILKKAEEKVNRKSNDINRKAIAEALKSMLIFFLAMIQYNIFRITKTALREKDDDVSRAIFIFIYYISEIIMLIFLSYQLQNLLVRIELEERNKAAHNNAIIE